MDRSPIGCCTSPGALCFCGAVFALAYGAALVLGGIALPSVFAEYSTATLFLAMGAACAATWWRYRTFHCAITGPLFIIAAAGLAATGGRLADQPAFWGLVLIVVGVAFLMERRVAA
jgi:hypothetical protein